jgi:hypothetical protein
LCTITIAPSYDRASMSCSRPTNLISSTCLTVAGMF